MADRDTTMIPEDEVRQALAPNYILERELGRGGMGAVYLARDVRLDRLVAIKFLPPEMAEREDLRARFLQETRTAASFSHPNIVPVHSVEERDRVLCFVMGFVDGETLTARITRTGPMAPTDAIKLLQECAWALSYAHGRGVVHRDVKPDNILIDRASGRAMITDFGISRSQEASGLTMVGELMGTPQFMSPEQATGEALDGRSDLYSLGIVAFYALTGRLPFESNSAHGYLTAHITRAAPPLSSVRGDVPQALASAVDRLLQKSPTDRFQTGEELADYLDPLRSARREIAPAIRIFSVKSGQVVRNGLILLALGPTLSQSVGGEADQLIILAMTMAAAVALFFQAVSGLRELATQGFTHEDLRNGIFAIRAEEQEAYAQVRAAPDWSARRKQQHWKSLIGMVVAITLITSALSTRVQTGPHRYQTPAIGILGSALGAAIFISTLIYTIAGFVGGAKLDNRLSRIWTGPIGRKLFDVIQRRGVKARPNARVMSVELGPLTLFEGMPKDVRRELSDLTRVVNALVARQTELVEKEMRLSSSQEDATRGTAGVATDTLDRVVNELTQAKVAAVRMREEIATALERLRLELIRLRSGIGTIAEVKAEAERSKALLSNNQ